MRGILSKCLDWRKKQMRRMTMPLVKVLLANHAMSEATWELEQEMQITYPHLFL